MSDHVETWDGREAHELDWTVYGKSFLRAVEGAINGVPEQEEINLGLFWLDRSILIQPSFANLPSVAPSSPVDTLLPLSGFGGGQWRTSNTGPANSTQIMEFTWNPVVRMHAVLVEFEASLTSFANWTVWMRLKDGAGPGTWTTTGTLIQFSGLGDCEYTWEPPAGFRDLNCTGVRFVGFSGTIGSTWMHNVRFLATSPP